jgi:hypothetical protein
MNISISQGLKPRDKTFRKAPGPGSI